MYDQLHTLTTMLTVNETSSLFDKTIEIVVHSLRPNQSIILHLLLMKDDGITAQYQSWARYIANERGIVDVSIDPAQDGTYTGNASMIRSN